MPTTFAEELAAARERAGQPQPPTAEPHIGTTRTPPSESAGVQAAAGSPSEQAPEREIPDVPQGTFCTVFAGPYDGRYGVFTDVATRYSDGTPENVIVQTRDADDLRIVVAYADIKPDVAGKR